MTRALLALLACAPAATAVDRKDLKPGLVATVTAGGRTTTRLDPAVALAAKAGEATRVAWAGFVRIDTPGNYTFTPAADGGRLALRVNGQPVTSGKAITLAAGVLPLEATFEPTGAPARAELLWQGPGFGREPVPHYLLGHRPADRPERFAADAKADAGRFLFEELACGRCHAPAKGEAFAERTGPDLTAVGRRVYAGWLDAWLADPAAVRPHTAMPKMFADDLRGRAERFAVVRYLTSLSGPLAESRVPSFSNEWNRSIAAGERLFTGTGCAACHGAKPAGTMKLTEDDDAPAKLPPPEETLYGFGSPTGGQAVYALGGLGSKTTPAELERYLRDPLRTNPHGRMPNMQLAGDEARDLARFLCRATDDRIDRLNPKGTRLEPDDAAKGIVPDADRKAFDRLAADDKWKDLGRRVVAAKGCANCHTLPKDVPAAKAPDLAAIAKRSGRGCLAESPDPAKVPAYPLDAGRRAALAAFLADRSPPAPGYATRAAIKRFNCLNCHIRDGEGGIGTELADRMKALEKGESADNDVLPPRLTGVGHKARPGWLRSVLLAGGRARPWMGLRMPQYGETNVGGLPEALAAGDGAAPEAEAKPAAVVSSQIEAGRKLAGKEGLGCIGCHDVSGFAGGGTRGPDLALTSQRVRPDWYRRWMHNPQRLAPGTRMPQNFNDGRSAFAGVLNGDAETQIDALWAYFALGPGLPLPAGLEPPKGLVIPVRERPEILRTFLPDGAGTRAVAVGYPGGVNLAFDAHAARLAYAWEGNFLDASPVWTNRGGAPAKLLGPKFLVAPSGNPWAVTAGDSPPDFTKRADDYAWGKAVPNDAIYAGRMNVRFEGYALDAGGRPTFRYRVGERDDATLGVADTPSPARSGVATGLTRRFALDLPAGGRTVWLLGGVSEKPPRTTGSAVGSTVVLPDAGRATVLRLSAAPAGSEWWLVRADAGWQAVLRIPTGAGGTASVELTTWALPRDDDGLLPGLGR